jgi:hypothetical protein
MEADFTNPDTVEQWHSIQERLRAGEMPPEDQPRPDAKQVAAVIQWIDARLLEVAARRKAEGRTVLRRLNRVEYQNTVRDLLGVDIDLKDMLPEDPVAFGFDNVAAALNISPVQMERYLEAADLALDAAVASGPRPETISRRYEFARSVPPFYSKMAPRHEQALLVFRVKELILNGPTLMKFQAPAAGVYRFRISASAYRSPDKPIIMTALVGSFGEFGVGGGTSHLAGYHEVPPGEPTIVEIVERLRAKGDTIKLYPADIAKVSLVSPKEYSKSPCLAIEWIEVEGPLYTEWPPPSHRRLFGGLDLTKGTLADAEQVLRGFLPRAFRRSLSDDDMRPYLELVGSALDEGQPFEQAMRAGLKLALCSPRFLFLNERPGKLDDFALASRLSYFLWNSMPDEELLEAARRGGLAQPEVLHGQVERVLKSPRAAAFTENFLGQWLNLRQINFTTPDKQLYPEFDDLLEWSMVRETHLFFEELLRHDLSVLNFVDSDFTMLNERLARHYGIADVLGLEFRKVALRPEYGRGGVLTQGSVLKVTANGTTTSPVVRGVWVLDRILDKPPKPPPADVPKVEPDIRGATTIREQLARHREAASCASCHKQIDPPGHALENYDPIGGWRARYRTLTTEGRPDQVVLGELVYGDGVTYREGAAVEAGDILADGRKFADLAGLKKLLLEDPDQITRALTKKLVVYATGNGLEYGDRDVVEQIVARTREQKYGLRSLVHAVVQSELFLNK